MDDFKYFIKDAWAPTLIVVLAFAVLIGATIGGQLLLNRHYCHKFQEFNPDLLVQWDLYLGCMVKYNNVWVNRSELINVIGEMK